MNLNKAMIIGNVVRDPETRTTPNGKTVGTFSVATNYSWTDAAGNKQDKAEFHNIVAWGKLAEICAQFLTKGRKVYIEGRIQTRDWEGQDGVKRYRTEIICDNMILLDRPPQSNSQQPTANNQQPTADRGQPPAGGGVAEAIPVIERPVEPGSEEIRVEDIPF
ncbi:MAG: single-stranded DNA-binding protein [Patescibacteria group bacterium]